MAMSLSMASGLNALISVNSAMANLQTQATSGKKINGPQDGLAAYLSAKGYSQRAERLQNINDTLSNNLQTIKAAQTGLDSIRKTVSDTLDTLKAASQTQSFVAATNQTDTVSGEATTGTQFSLGFGALTAGGVQINNVAISRETTLVAPTVTGNPNAVIALGGQKLSEGQTFTINNYSFKIATAANTDDGSSTAKAKNVTTIGEFIDAVKTALGKNGSVSTIPAGANLNYAMYGSFGRVNFTLNNNGLANTTNKITFAQDSSGAQINLLAAFTATRAKPANFAGTTYDSDDVTNNNAAGFTLTGNAHAITGGTAGQTADSRRAAAAKSYKTAMDQINQYLRNASVSGTNLLSGDLLKVTFDEKGTSSTFQITDANNAALKFDAASLGLVNAQTGVSADLATNFQVNDDAALDANGNSTLGLNAAINKLTNSLSSLSLGDSQVAQFTATVSNRVDFNKSIVGLLNDAGNSLTAADMTQVSAQYASLQVQQGFAQSILANTKQSDQSLMQLLR